MGEIKALFTDLDGTVLRGKPSVTPTNPTLKAYNRLLENNVAVIPCTGRDFFRSFPYIEPFQFQSFGIFNGGARIAHLPTREVISETRISHETTLSIVDHFMSYAERIGYGRGHERPENLNIADIDEGALSIWIELHEQNLAKAGEFLLRGHGVQFHENRGSTTPPIVGLDITHESICKGISTLHVLDRLGIAPENAAAIGDAMNDAPMLRQVGLSFAMGNAVDELKQIADVTVDSIEQEGFSQAVDYILAA